MIRGSGIAEARGRKQNEKGNLTQRGAEAQSSLRREMPEHGPFDSVQDKQECLCHKMVSRRRPTLQTGHGAV